MTTSEATGATEKSGDSGFESRAGLQRPVGPMVRRLTTEFFLLLFLWFSLMDRIPYIKD